MSQTFKSKRRVIKLTYGKHGDLKVSERPIDRGPSWEELEEANRFVARETGSTIFFPTFRRIEGGFTIAPRIDEETYLKLSPLGRRRYEAMQGAEHGRLQQAMDKLSERLTVGGHRFVASISTDDIVRLVTSKYAEISETTNRLHMELSRFILERIGGGTDPDAASREALAEIRLKARSVTERSEAQLRPFTVLSELVARVFQYKGIRLTGPVTLGETKEAILSDLMSAGEKQMLSFLCYNAFASKSCLFIDEPETSLHADWQRVLFPILLDQSTGNQFIVATHSPFIYTKYSDKELILSQGPGDTDADTLDDGSGDHSLSGAHAAADGAG